MNKQIAKITSTQLGFEAHGIFTALISLDYGCMSQTIGGYCMSNSVHDDRTLFATTPLAADFIVGMLRACGVDRWERLVGRTIHVIFDGDEMGLNTMPLGIEPLPTEKGERFMFAEWQAHVRAALPKQKLRTTR